MIQQALVKGFFCPFVLQKLLECTRLLLLLALETPSLVYIHAPVTIHQKKKFKQLIIFMQVKMVIVC